MSVGENVSLKHSKVADGVSVLTDSVNDVSKGSCGVVWVNVDRIDSLHN